MAPLDLYQITLFGIPILLYAIPFAFSKNLVQREKATRKDYEIEKLADSISVNPFSSRTGSAIVGSNWQLIGYIIFAYVYVTSGPKKLLHTFAEPFQINLIQIFKYQYLSDMFGILVHSLYIPGFLLCFFVIGVILFFLDSIISGVINGLFISAAGKFKGIPLMLSTPLTSFFFLSFSLHRKYRYIFTNKIATHEEFSRLVSPLFNPIILLLGGSKEHWSSGIDVQELLAEIKESNRFFVIKWISRIESILILICIGFLAVELFSREEQSLITLRLGIINEWVQDAFTILSLSTFIGVLMILHGATFTEPETIGDLVVDRLFISFLACVTIVGSIVFNPTWYLDFLPTVWTIFDVIILIYIPLTVGRLTIHLLGLYPEVTE